ncbi:MAG: undecaprenyl-diphosphate phosphatase [Pirellulaceae bacterium]|jgi:undecaprenyl-diphosphatase|nr:undecaprenyl-diphosphate phosphatase [Pirellulaceae bacterium]
MSDNWLTVFVVAALMGVVEGVTEFIPVSSTGHLILAGDLLGFESLVGEGQAKTFEIFIQLGAILAVVVAYPRRFSGLVRLGDNSGFSGLRGLSLLLLTSLPAGLLGLVARGPIKEYLFQPLTVAAGLAAGAVWILVAERWPRPVRRAGLDALRWQDALVVGLFQCLALWPGMSRSSSTILGGMMLGIERKTAAEYSFFAAVPLLAAAALYELYKSRSTLHAADIPWFAVGFAVSYLFAWLSVRFFIRFLSQHTLAMFGWYRLAIAAAALLWALGE